MPKILHLGKSNDPYIFMGRGVKHGVNIMGVTSVAISVPAYMSVGGSPITTSGTIALDFNPQNPNLVFASPVSIIGQPSFRSLDKNDMPAHYPTQVFSTLPSLVMDGDTGIIYDTLTSSISIDWFYRSLIDQYGNTILNWSIKYTLNPATAGAIYGATEQQMLNDVYQAFINCGLGA
jgi:hypothetical protein